MLDHGVHPPTVYFPLLVDEALMIEPTETETKERLDHFAEVVRAILEEAAEDPEVARERAPHHAGAPPRRGGRGEAPGGALATAAEELESRLMDAAPAGTVVGSGNHPGGAAARRPQPRAAARGAAASDHARRACTTS